MNVLKKAKPVLSIAKTIAKTPLNPLNSVRQTQKYASTFSKAIKKSRQNAGVDKTESYQSLLAQAAYQKNPEEFMRKKGYNVTTDKIATNKNWVTFVDENGKATVSFRGTQPTNWRDLTTDLLIATGLEKYGTRFQHAERDLKKVIDKYGVENVSTTGHSLGGSLSLYAGSKLGVDNYAYNPGIAKASQVSDKSKIFVKGFDPVSNSVLFNEGVQKKATVQAELPTSFNVHTIGQDWGI